MVGECLVAALVGGSSEAWQTKKSAACDCFKRNDFEQAIRLYGEALLLLEDTASKAKENQDGSDSASDSLTEEKVKLQANIAQCHLKLDDANSAIEFCNSILVLQPGNEKALFRRARAYELSGESYRANSDFRKCYETHKTRSALVELHRFKSDCEAVHKQFSEVLIKRFCCTEAIWLTHEEQGKFTSSSRKNSEPFRVHAYQGYDMSDTKLDGLFSLGGGDFQQSMQDMQRRMAEKSTNQMKEHPLHELDDVVWCKVDALLHDVSSSVPDFLPVLFDFVCNTVAGQNANPFRFLVAGLKGREVLIPFVARFEILRVFLKTISIISTCEVSATTGELMVRSRSQANFGTPLCEKKGLPTLERRGRLAAYVSFVVPLFFEKYVPGAQDTRILIKPRVMGTSTEVESLCSRYNVVAQSVWRFISTFAPDELTALGVFNFVERLLYPREDAMTEREDRDRRASDVKFIHSRLSKVYETCRTLFKADIHDLSNFAVAEGIPSRTDKIDNSNKTLAELRQFADACSRTPSLGTFLIQRMPQYLNLAPPPTLQSPVCTMIEFDAGPSFDDARFLWSLNDFPDRLVRKMFQRVVQCPISVLGGQAFKTEFEMLKVFKASNSDQTLRKGDRVMFVRWCEVDETGTEIHRAQNRRRGQDTINQYHYLVFYSRAHSLKRFHDEIRPGFKYNCLHANGDWRHAVVLCEAPAMVVSELERPARVGSEVVKVVDVPRITLAKSPYWWVQELDTVRGHPLGPMCCVHKLCLRPWTEHPCARSEMSNNPMFSMLVPADSSVGHKGIFRLPAHEEGQLFKRVSCPAGESTTSFGVANQHWGWIVALAREWWNESSLPLLPSALGVRLHLPGGQACSLQYGNAESANLEDASTSEPSDYPNQTKDVAEETRTENLWKKLDDMYAIVESLIAGWRPLAGFSEFAIYDLVHRFVAMRSRGRGLGGKQKSVAPLFCRLTALQDALSCVSYFGNVDAFSAFFQSVLETRIDVNFVVALILRDDCAGATICSAVHGKTLTKLLTRLHRNRTALSSLPAMELREEVSRHVAVLAGSKVVASNPDDAVRSATEKLVEDCKPCNLPQHVASACVLHGLEEEVRAICMKLHKSVEDHGLTEEDLRFETEVSDEKRQQKIDNKTCCIFGEFMYMFEVRPDWHVRKDHFYSLLVEHDMCRRIADWSFAVTGNCAFNLKKVIRALCASTSPGVVAPHLHPEAFQHLLHGTTLLVHHAMELDGVERDHKSFEGFRGFFKCGADSESHSRDHQHPFHPNSTGKGAWTYLLSLFTQLVDQDAPTDCLAQALDALVGLYKKLRVDLGDSRHVHYYLDKLASKDGHSQDQITAIFGHWMNRAVAKTSAWEVCNPIARAAALKAGAEKTLGQKLTEVLFEFTTAYAKLADALAVCSTLFDATAEDSADVGKGPGVQLMLLSLRNARLWESIEGIQFIANNYLRLRSITEYTMLSRALYACERLADVEKGVGFLQMFSSHDSLYSLFSSEYVARDWSEADDTTNKAEVPTWSKAEFLRYCCIFRVKELNFPDNVMQGLEEDATTATIFRLYTIMRRFPVPDLSEFALSTEADATEISEDLDILKNAAIDSTFRYDFIAVLMKWLADVMRGSPTLSKTYACRRLVALICICCNRLNSSMGDIWEASQNQAAFLCLIHRFCTDLVASLHSFDSVSKLSETRFDEVASLYALSLHLSMLLHMLPLSDVVEELIVTISSFGHLLQDMRTVLASSCFDTYHLHAGYQPLDPTLPHFVPSTPANYVHSERSSGPWLAFNMKRPMHLEFSSWMSLSLMHLRAANVRIEQYLKVALGKKMVANENGSSSRPGEAVQAPAATTSSDDFSKASIETALFSHSSDASVSLCVSTHVLETVKQILVRMETKTGGECFIPFPVQFIPNSVLFRGLGDRDGVQRSFEAVVDLLTNGFCPADLAKANPFGQSASRAGQLFFTHELGTASAYLSSKFQDGALVAVDANCVNHVLRTCGGRIERESVLQLALYALPVGAIRLLVLPGAYEKDLRAICGSETPETEGKLMDPALLQHEDFQRLTPSQMTRMRSTLRLLLRGKTLMERIAFFRPQDFDRGDLSKFVEKKLEADGNIIVSSTGFRMVADTMVTVLGGWTASRHSRPNLLKNVLSTILQTDLPPASLRDVFARLDDRSFGVAFLALDDFLPRLVWLQDLIAQKRTMSSDTFFDCIGFGLVNSGTVHKMAEAMQDLCGASLLQKLRELLRPLQAPDFPDAKFYIETDAFTTSAEEGGFNVDSMLENKRLLHRLCFLGLYLPELRWSLEYRFEVSLSVAEYVAALAEIVVDVEDEQTCVKECPERSNDSSGPIGVLSSQSGALLAQVQVALEAYVELCGDLRDGQSTSFLVDSLESFDADVREVVTRLVWTRTACLTAVIHRQMLEWRSRGATDLMALIEAAQQSWGPTADMLS